MTDTAAQTEAPPTEFNDQMFLIGGLSGKGKSAALRNIRNQPKWLYLNAEAGKRLPFRNDFINVRVQDPYHVGAYVDDAINNPDKVDGIIIDSSTFLMDMFETMYIRTATNTQQAWGDYSNYFKDLLQVRLVRFGKPVIVIAHVLENYEDNGGILTLKKSVPIKGALKNNGVEAYFSTVVEATTKPLKDLEGYESELLTITEDEEELGFKYVFQTRLTKETVGTRIRSPMGMFSKKETFIDNDAQKVLDRLHQFYDGNK
jgi:hypothetical protein